MALAEVQQTVTWLDFFDQEPTLYTRTRPMTHLVMCAE